jgi:hypothetical protein
MNRTSPAIPIGLVICLLLALSLFVGVVWAKPTTPDQAKKVVMNWLGKDTRPLGARLGRQIKEVQTYYDGGALAAVIHPYPTQAEAIRQTGDLYNRTRLTPFVKKLFTRFLSWRR